MGDPTYINFFKHPKCNQVRNINWSNMHHNISIKKLFKTFFFTCVYIYALDYDFFFQVSTRITPRFAHAHHICDYAGKR